MANSAATAEPVIESKESVAQTQSEESWLSSLPEDIRGDESITKFKDVPALAKSYVELQKHVGGTVKLPQEGASKAELDAFYAKLGRPGTPEEYGIARPKELPASIPWDENFAKTFSQKAHGLGLSKSQAAGLVEFWNGHVAELSKEVWTQERGLAELEVKDGKEAATKIVANVQRGLKELGYQDFNDWLDETGAGNHPVVLRALAKFGAKFEEDSLPDGGQPSGTGITVDEARREIAQIRSDKSHPYHKGDEVAVAHMNKLYEIVRGKKVVLEVK